MNQGYAEVIMFMDLARGPSFKGRTAYRPVRVHEYLRE
jgi:hypothetical protein